MHLTNLPGQRLILKSNFNSNPNFADSHKHSPRCSQCCYPRRWASHSKCAALRSVYSAHSRSQSCMPGCQNHREKSTNTYSQSHPQLSCSCWHFHSTIFSTCSWPLRTRGSSHVSFHARGGRLSFALLC